MLYSLGYKGDKKDSMKKWKLAAAVILQLGYYALGIYNKSPFVLAQFFIVLGIWMYWLGSQDERGVYVVIAGVAVVGLLVTGLGGMAEYEKNIKTVDKEISKEVRELSVSEDFLYPADNCYTFFVRDEDGSIESITVEKENVKIYDNLSKDTVSYVEVKEMLEQRWNHNHHTPTVDVEFEKNSIYYLFTQRQHISCIKRGILKLF